MAERVLKIKTVSEVSEAVAGLTDLTGSLKGVGTAAIEAAGKAKGEWVALEAEWKKANPALKGVADAAFEVESALNKMGRAGSESQLEGGLVKAQVALDRYKAKLDEVRAAGGTIDEGMRGSLAVMESSIQAGTMKLVAMREETARAKATIASLSEEARKSGQAAQQFGEEWRKSAYAAGDAARKSAGEQAKLGTQAKSTGTAMKGLKDNTDGVAKGMMAASGAVGPFGEILEKLKVSSDTTTGKLAGLAFEAVAIGGAFKIGYDAGTKFNEFLQNHGNYLEKAIDKVTSLGSAYAGMKANMTGLAADIDLENAALTEHTKSLLAQIVARAAARKATEEADAAIKAALPGWKSAADQQKELNTTIENTARKFADLQKNGADWKKEVEANQEPLTQFVETLNAQKVAIETLPEPLQQAIKYLQELKAAAEGAGGAASGIEKLKAAIEGLGSAGTADSIKSIAEALATIRAEGGNTGDAFASNIDAMRELREQAKGSYDTLDAFRKQILDQIPAYQAMALVNEDYVGALDKMDAAYARIAEARRAANEADIEALANMERMEAQARSMTTSIDTIGEAWYRATGQVAGFTVEVRTATKAVEETNPQFDLMIEELAKVSDEYGRMVPWMGALIAQLEKGTISVEEFLVQIDAMNRGFLQIQGMSGNMFGDIGSEVARLTKIINDFVGGERKRTRDSRTRDWRKKS